MKQVITTNFGFAAYLKVVKDFEIEKISSKDGIYIKIPDDIFQSDLKLEYNKSKFSAYNAALREIINKFKNS